MTPQNKDVAMTPNQRALEALDDAFAEKDNEKSWQYVALAIGEHLNTIRAALLSEVQAWQPILSAPRDGTTIDLWHEGHGRYTNMHWCQNRWEDTNSGIEYTGFTHWQPPPPAAPKDGE